MRKIALRPIKDEDIILVTTWLKKEYILKWYHHPEDWLTEINNRNGIYSWIHHFIVMDENTPIGFCQYYDCFNANDIEDWYKITEKNHTFSIDYLIGNEAYLGKGYGKAIVSLLTDTIKEKEEGKQIIVQPDKENIPSIKALLSNGYIYDEEKDYYYKLID